MNKIGIIADIHGNLNALKTAIDLLYGANAQKLVVCGDVIGYGMFPNECCDILRELNCTVVAGNHDWAVAGLTDYKGSFSQTAIQGVEFTRRIIRDDNLKWLQALKLYHRERHMEFVHASLMNS